MNGWGTGAGRRTDRGRSWKDQTPRGRANGYGSSEANDERVRAAVRARRCQNVYTFVHESDKVGVATMDSLLECVVSGG